MKSLYTTKVPYRFRCGLVDFYEGSGGSDSHDSSGKSHGQSDSSGSGGAEGSEPDTMEGMTVTGQDLSGTQPGGNGSESESGFFSPDFTSNIDADLSLSLDKASMIDKLKTYALRAVQYGLTQNVVAKTLQRAFNFLNIDVDIEDSAAKALTSLSEDNPTMDEKDLASKSLISGLTTATASMAELDSSHGGESTVADFTAILDNNFNDSFADSNIDPETGQSTLAEKGTWEHFAEQFFGTEEGTVSMEDALQGQADYFAEQTNKWNERQADAVAEETGLLDDLIDQSKTGTGLFSPTKFKLAGQDVEFVPRAKREQAAQLADLGASRYGAQTSFADSALEKSSGASPYAGRTAYLDSLSDMSKLGTTFSLAEGEQALTASGQGDARDANEPGILDYIQAVGSLF